MSTVERIAATAYAEYCYQVYKADANWGQWQMLPAYVRRAWISAIGAAVKEANK